MAQRVRKAWVLAAFAVSLLFLLAALAGPLAADEAEQAPLVVPIFPHQRTETPLPDGADLRDSYVVLEDGSVFSMADWVLGAVRRDPVAGNLSDFDSRLFLGQVARSMAGQSEQLVNRSVVDVGPLIPFRAGPPVAAPLRAVQGLVGLFMVQYPEGYSPATSGGALSPVMRTEGGAAILFEGQLAEALSWTMEDLKHAGIMQSKLSDYKKTQEKAAEDQ